MANEQDIIGMKRFFPRGLYGRAVLILFLPIVVVTLVVSVMFLQRHFEDVTMQMTDSMTREIGFVGQTMRKAENAGAAMRAGTAIGDPLGLTISRSPDADSGDSRRIYDFSGRIVIEQFRENLPDIRGIDLASDIKTVELTFDGKYGPYILTFPRSRVSASNPHQLLVLMLFTSFLMSGIATIFLRNQLRPIRRLARAADAYGKGRIDPYRPSGAIEVRRAGTAFLDMRNRLERQNDQRKVMLSGISHDLRTPLTRLRLGLSVLVPEVPPDKEDISAMEADIAEMNRMIDAFLDYARKDAQETDPQPVVAKEFLLGIVADAQRAGQEVALHCFSGDEEGEATLRPDMLRRAVENLVGNAVRYGSKAEIDAALGPRSLRISVEDDGPGIPDNARETAMRPFTRLDTSRSRNRGEGAGLGLAIAADVARGHGGQLRLGRSERLGGLRADIVIPR